MAIWRGRRAELIQNGPNPVASLCQFAPAAIAAKAAHMPSRPFRRSRRPRFSRWLRVIMSLALLAAFAWAAWLWDGADRTAVRPPPGVAARAIDGDSLIIPAGDGGTTIRLEGIDAPEFRQTCARADGSLWPCGAEAHAALATYVLEPGLYCGVRARDDYQRGVAMCRTDRTPDISAAMVSRGLAIASGRGDFPEYALDEDRARAARRGIWQGAFQRPAEWRAAHPR
jgi:endonuclease YncB( thermonuclease family)